MIRARQISKRLGGRQVLDGIDFEVAPGEIVAIIGPSGGGKTTLLRSLSLLAPPDSGTLVIADQRFRFPEQAAVPWQTIYPRLTVVFQQFPLWPHLNVRRNLLMPLKLRGESNAEQKMNELCEELGLTVYLNRFPAELSVGQRQRVAFARALLLRPKYLLLDEITSAQDVEHIKRMMSLIKKVAANQTSIVLATHLIRFARRLASRFYFIDHGHIVEEGLAIALQKPTTERLKDFLLVGDEL
jgi:ABC-type polar amino acid transport system ATPase subunit